MRKLTESKGKEDAQESGSIMGTSGTGTRDSSLLEHTVSLFLPASLFSPTPDGLSPHSGEHDHY